MSSYHHPELLLSFSGLSIIPEYACIAGKITILFLRLVLPTGIFIPVSIKAIISTLNTDWRKHPFTNPTPMFKIAVNRPEKIFVI